LSEPWLFKHVFCSSVIFHFPSPDPTSTGALFSTLSYPLFHSSLFDSDRPLSFFFSLPPLWRFRFPVTCRASDGTPPLSLAQRGTHFLPKTGKVAFSARGTRSRLRHCSAFLPRRRSYFRYPRFCRPPSNSFHRISTPSSRAVVTRTTVIITSPRPFH